MQMDMTFEEDFDLFDVLEEKLEDLNQHGEFAFGMWDNGSTHYSGYSFPTLLKLLSEGGSTDEGTIPPRPVLVITTDFFPLESSPIKKALDIFLSLKNKNKAGVVGRHIGSWYAETAKSLFGDPAFLPSNSLATQRVKRAEGVIPPNQPLVWKGDLKAHMQYSYNGIVKYAA